MAAKTRRFSAESLAAAVSRVTSAEVACCVRAYTRDEDDCTARQAFRTADSSCSAPGSVTEHHAGFQRTFTPQPAKTPSTGQRVLSALTFFLNPATPTLTGTITRPLEHSSSSPLLSVLFSQIPASLREDRAELSNPPLHRTDARREVMKCEKTSGLSRFGVRHCPSSPRQLV